MSKSDFETLIFDIYIEHMLDEDLPFDDYTIDSDTGAIGQAAGFSDEGVRPVISIAIGGDTEA